VTTRDRFDRGDAEDALAAHARACPDCESSTAPTDRLATILSAFAVHIDVAGLSRRTLQRVQPELQRRARAMFRRQVMTALLLAALPLPAVLAYDTYLLQLAHAFISAVLPAAIATYLIISYAAFLLLLFATTYAAIPLILSRGAPAESSAAS